jgi:glyoxylase-like metal-dependent hydrolase (beta-lactamase superfamily II)
MDDMQFLTLDDGDFSYATVETVAPNVRRVLAENPSKFTYRGTGTYIIGDGDVVVIDPGPRLDSHRDALAAALRGEVVRAILVTHCHADHSPLATWLAAESDAPTIAQGPHGDATWDLGHDPPELEPPAEGSAGDEAGVGADAMSRVGVGGEAPTVVKAAEGSAGDEAGVGADAMNRVGVGGEAPTVVEESTDTDFAPDVTCATGDIVATGQGWTMSAIHTPGHTSNHTCFALDDGTRRTLFTGDHVMGWSTTVVSPPDGDMAAYIESLRVVGGRHDDLAIPTHGPPIPDPTTYIDALIAHRLDREAQVLEGVRRGLTTLPALVLDLYADVRQELHKPAARSVLAHLVKLVDDGTVAIDGPEEHPRLDGSFSAA